PWLAGFLVLTIAGERLELSRLVGATGRSRAVFVAIVAVLLAGLVLSATMPSLGIRTTGAALLALAVWLARNDVARRTVRMSGAARYMALALLAGYLWMAVTGALWLGIGQLHDGGPHQPYDAMLHALFLGFVISMIFAHAPVVIPAVLGRPLPYRPGFYLPLALLHGSLLRRPLGGAAGRTQGVGEGGGGGDDAEVLVGSAT